MTTPSQTQERLSLSTVAAFIGVFVVFALSRFALDRLETGSAAAIGVALLPLPGILWMYSLMFREALSGDELERRVALEGLSIGFGLTVAVVIVLGLLENAVEPGSLWVDFSDIQMFSLAFSFLGYWWARRRYE